MFFIWGWGHRKVKEYGPVLKHECTNCRNITFWQLYEISEWFTFFFIPIIPYKRVNTLSCPICNNFIELKGEQFDYYKDIAAMNQLYNTYQISMKEYKVHLEKINKNLEQDYERQKD